MTTSAVSTIFGMPRGLVRFWPWCTTTRRLPVKRLASLAQLPTTAGGATTSVGPLADVAAMWASRCGVAGDLQHDAGLAGRALFGRDALAFGFGLLRRSPRRLVRGLDRRHPAFALMVEDRLAKVAEI